MVKCVLVTFHFHIKFPKYTEVHSNSISHSTENIKCGWEMRKGKSKKTASLNKSKIREIKL